MAFALRWKEDAKDVVLRHSRQPVVYLYLCHLNPDLTPRIERRERGPAKRSFRDHRKNKRYTRTSDVGDIRSPVQ